MDTYTLLLQISKKLDLLLNAHGLNPGTVHNEDSEEADYKYGRSLAREVSGRIRSDEK